MDLQRLVKRAFCKNSFSALLQEKRQPRRSFVAQSCLFAPVSLGLVSRLGFSSELDVQTYREMACKTVCEAMSHKLLRLLCNDGGRSHEAAKEQATCA